MYFSAIARCLAMATQGCTRRPVPLPSWWVCTSATTDLPALPPSTGQILLYRIAIFITTKAAACCCTRAACAKLCARTSTATAWLELLCKERAHHSSSSVAWYEMDWMQESLSTTVPPAPSSSATSETTHWPGLQLATQADRLSKTATSTTAALVFPRSTWARGSLSELMSSTMSQQTRLSRRRPTHSFCVASCATARLGAACLWSEVACRSWPGVPSQGTSLLASLCATKAPSPPCPRMRFQATLALRCCAVTAGAGPLTVT
mmetsp:Transcript_29164/g.67633  ORF Transcript_29164/g.67633 Transcript_29164/m.67633 type:complete len:263 (-) Transcript_29164:1134-1922(-)